jgi:hypothetical protein
MSKFQISLRQNANFNYDNGFGSGLSWNKIVLQTMTMAMGDETIFPATDLRDNKRQPVLDPSYGSSIDQIEGRYSSRATSTTFFVD